MRRFQMGRVLPTLLVCTLAAAPLTDALAGQLDGDKMVLPPQQTADASVSPSATPVEQPYLMTPQLAQAAEDQNDPLEGFNRAMFSFNEGFYTVVMRPVSSAYNLLPSDIRTIIGSFLSNLSSPIIFINDVLQGEFGRAMTTAERFLINTTVGFGGVADVATSAGLEGHSEDFGQTLATWGVGEGFYLVLPILGPSNPRDAIGRFVVDPLADPVNTRLRDTDNEEWMYGRFATSAVDQYSGIRDELDQIKKTSVDYYAAIRSLYRQKRESEISNGGDMDLPPIPDFEFGHNPNSTPADPATNANGNALKNADQASLREIDRKIEAQLIQNPFDVRFVPAVSAREMADSGDSLRPAPRKPAEFDWIGSNVPAVTGRDTLVAEMSWEAVTFTAPR